MGWQVMHSEPTLPGTMALNRQLREPRSQADKLIGFNLKGHPLHLRRDAYLFRDHDPAGNLYGVIDGVLRAERVTASGRQQILNYFEEGNIIGFALQSVQHYSAVAITPATLLCFPAAAVEQAAKASPLLASRLVSLTTRSLSDILDVLALQSHYPACEGFSAYLLALFDRNHLRTKSREILELPTSRRDVADLLGIDVNTVAISILTLQDHGTLLVRSARLLELIDRARLESSVLMRRRRPLS